MSERAVEIWMYTSTKVNYNVKSDIISTETVLHSQNDNTGVMYYLYRAVARVSDRDRPAVRLKFTPPSGLTHNAVISTWRTTLQNGIRYTFPEFEHITINLVNFVGEDCIVGITFMEDEV